jgi:hypothetical protein
MKTDKEFNFDEIKNSWRNQSIKNINNEEIKQATAKKSVTIVKYIFWISITEFIFVFFSNFILPNELDSSYYKNLSQSQFIKMKFWEGMMNDVYYINTFISVIFLMLFYIKYKKITGTTSIAENIERIMNFRKIVKFFIFWNVLLSIVYVFIIGNYLLEPFYNAGILTKNLTNSLLIIGLLSVIIIGFSVLYYQLIFGIFLKKLKRNLEELKK